MGSVRHGIDEARDVHDVRDRREGSHGEPVLEDEAGEDRNEARPRDEVYRDEAVRRGGIPVLDGERHADRV